MDTDIKITRAWLERLVELKDVAMDEPIGNRRDAIFHHILGYIESAKEILKDK